MNGWQPYIPETATLVLLFKAARIRLMANAAAIEALSDARIASATEEMNRISDDIRDARIAGPLNHPPARPSKGFAYVGIAMPMDTAAAPAALRITDPDAPRQ
jgi:hypothetical protein